MATLCMVFLLSLVSKPVSYFTKKSAELRGFDMIHKVFILSGGYAPDS